MRRDKRRLGEILIEQGLITEAQLSEALKEQAKTRYFLGEVLVKKEYVKEKDIVGVLSKQYGLPVVSLKNIYIDWGMVQGFSGSLIFDHKCFPLKKDSSSVTFAIRNPLDAWALKRIEEEAGVLSVKLVLASEEDINDAFGRYQQYLRNSITRISES